MLNSLWFRIKWLFANSFIPTDETELINIAVDYSWNHKQYRYFLGYEEQFGTGPVRDFWTSVLPWIKDLVKDGSDNWSPLQLEGWHTPAVANYALPYYSADALARKIFLIEDTVIQFSPFLETISKQDFTPFFEIGNLPVSGF